MIILDVSFPATLHDFDTLSAKVEKAAGQECDAAGYGFGGRDMEFSFKTLKLAKQAAERIEKLSISGLQCEMR